MIINPVVSGIQLPDLTTPAGAGQILSGYQAINEDGEIITGTIPSQGAQTITPGTSNKTIASGRYLSGTQTIAGDSDLIASNIKSGINIFGVTGNYSGAEVQRITISGDDSSITKRLTGTQSSRYIYIYPPSPIKELCSIVGAFSSENTIYPGFFYYPSVSYWQDDMNTPTIDGINWDCVEGFQANQNGYLTQFVSSSFYVSSNQITIRGGGLMGSLDNLLFITYTYIPA